MQKDYLLRQIEKMGVVLAGIRNRAFSGAPVQALAELRQVAARAGIELEFLDRLSPDSLLEILGRSNLAKLLPAAEVLAVKAEIEGQLQQEEERRRSLEKLARLAGRIRILVGEGADPELRERVDALLDRLPDGAGGTGP